MLIKTSRIHGRTNAALGQAEVGLMLMLIRTLSADYPVVLRLQNDFLFCDSHLKMTRSNSRVLEHHRGVE
ncbi:MAG: hypothetical protein U0231_12690 [Nitrospiraceae bacterium]